MNAIEARVLILSEPLGQPQTLAAFVEERGGTVVDIARASRTVYDRHETLPGDPNVVIFSSGQAPGNPEQFVENYRVGRMSRANIASGIGPAAMSSTLFPNSPLVRATGANFLPHLEGAIGRWEQLLEPHPATPLYLPNGAIERHLIGPYESFEDTLRILFGNPELSEAEPVRVGALAIKETVRNPHSGKLRTTEETKSWEIRTMRPSEVATIATTWKHVDTRNRPKAGRRQVTAVIHANDETHFISHTETRSRGLHVHVQQRGTRDSVRDSSLHALPATYAPSFGLPAGYPFN